MDQYFDDEIDFWGLLLRDIRLRSSEFASEFTLESLEEAGLVFNLFNHTFDRESFINTISFDMAVKQLTKEY